MARVRFSDVVKRVNVFVDREQTDLLYYVGGEHIDSDTFMVRKKGLIKGATIGYKFHFGFQPGHILFMSRNPHLRKCSMVDFAGVCSDSTYVVETRDENVLLQKYLLIEMQSDRFWKWAEENKSGSVNYLINYCTLDSYEFDLPPIAEQRTLSEKLWAANDLKEKYQNLLAATDEMLKAKFREMFSGVNSYEQVELSSVCDTFIDGDWIESKDQSPGGIRIVQTGNVGCGCYIDKADKARYVNDETFRRIGCTEIFPGDILISRLPDPVGRACVLPVGIGRAITAVDCTIVRTGRKILPDFLVAATMTADYQRQIDEFTMGTTRARVSRGNLSKIKIPLPPLALQREFVDIAKAAEASKAELKKSITSIDAVMKGLLNG